jgi:HSP20 family protein
MAAKNKEKTASSQPAETNEQRNLPVRANEQSRLPARRNEHPLARLRDEMDLLFDRFFGRWLAPVDWGWMPDRFWDLDVKETDKEFLVRAEAPGFEAKDFDINISGNTLTIRAEHHQEEEKEQEGYRYSERQFQRSIPLPAAVDADKVEARYRNGVLELHIPRTEEAHRRRIEVKQ